MCSQRWVFPSSQLTGHAAHGSPPQTDAAERNEYAKQKKTHNLKIRLDDIQYAMVQDSAREAGLTLTEDVRQQAVYGKIELHNHIVADFPKLEKLAREFAAIGNNLNQLTRYFNKNQKNTRSRMKGVTDLIQLTQVEKPVLIIRRLRNGCPNDLSCRRMLLGNAEIH